MSQSATFYPSFYSIIYSLLNNARDNCHEVRHFTPRRFNFALHMIHNFDLGLQKFFGDLNQNSVNKISAKSSYLAILKISCKNIEKWRRSRKKVHFCKIAN